MASWQQSNASSWYTTLVGSGWDDSQIKWDDPVALWDNAGVGDWQEANNPSWFTEN